MARARSAGDGQSRFPLEAALWDRVSVEMQLSPQQKRIVESLLAGKKCKEIGPELGLAAPTVRTYLKRIYERQGVEDHVALLLRIMAVAVRTPVQSTSHGQEPRPDDILREG